ncbi:hypothetical protein HJC23_006340 [Cyclotella cryptica]|uniref:Nicastrin n=1 Tax=Cyclotella cryptica TaxID=29204 RepID=A0ABD3Q4U9_9STRA|eukprot:CCRYP_008736-RA/>CCRYP_008736-RA protein AED:0.25 eAED:0.25 QI:31/1/1/1/0/0/2/190/814
MTTSNRNTTLSQPFNNKHFANIPHAACVTLFTRNGRVGCGTFDRNVQTGRLVSWTAVASHNNAANGAGRGLAGLSTVPPYVAVVDEADYTAETVAQLINYSQGFAAGDQYGNVDIGGPLRGILVLASANGGGSYASPEPLAPQGDNTPSEALTVSPSYEWNVNNNGDGLTTQDMYGLPTAYVYDSATVEYLREVASDQASLDLAVQQDGSDNAYPSILAEFNYYMGPATHDGSTATSKTCLEWKDVDGSWNPRCLPLGGNSVWSVAGSPLPLGYNAGDGRPVVWIAAGMDSTSMFHDMVPGANTAASNILAVLLAAQVIGGVKDEVLDQLYGRIGFALFQGEAYGYLGSRRFLKDVMGGFECQKGNEGVASVYKRKEEETTTRACLHPLRADLTFQNLGTVRGMIAVDQVGNLGGGKNFYVQGGESTGGFGGFLGQVMVELSTENYSVQASAASQNAQDDGSYPLPPTPLASLVKVSDSAYGGVVLTGYDDAFVANSYYHSHLDSTSKFQSIDSDAIATAATILARTAVAAAYQTEAGDVDAETAATYAKELIPDAVSSSSEGFQKLYSCLFQDGNCETFLSYATVEEKNDAARTGVDLGIGQPLKSPPNYYVSIYDLDNGQAAVRASGKLYGSLDDEDGDDVKSYGDDENDVFILRPSLLETSIFGIFNDYLGRGAFSNDEENSSAELVKCQSTTDCSSVSYCSTATSSLALPTCAGGQCICGSRSHYHPALDEAIIPTKNKYPNYFEIQEGDAGVSALYTEPFWDSGVGVRIYNDAGKTPGTWAMSMGAVAALVCFMAVYRLKKTLVKEKVY